MENITVKTPISEAAQEEMKRIARDVVEASSNFVGKYATPENLVLFNDEIGEIVEAIFRGLLEAAVRNAPTFFTDVRLIGLVQAEFKKYPELDAVTENERAEADCHGDWPVRASRVVELEGLLLATRDLLVRSREEIEDSGHCVCGKNPDSLCDVCSLLAELPKGG